MIRLWNLWEYMIYNWPRLPREREETQLGHIPRPTRELYHTHYKAVGTTPFTWYDRMYASEDGYQHPFSLLNYSRLGMYVDIPAGKQGRYIRTIQYNNASWTSERSSRVKFKLESSIRVVWGLIFQVLSKFVFHDSGWARELQSELWKVEFWGSLKNESDLPAKPG